VPGLDFIHCTDVAATRRSIDMQNSEVSRKARLAREALPPRRIEPGSLEHLATIAASRPQLGRHDRLRRRAGQAETRLRPRERYGARSRAAMYATLDRTSIDRAVLAEIRRAATASTNISRRLYQRRAGAHRRQTDRARRRTIEPTTPLRPEVRAALNLPTGGMNTPFLRVAVNYVVTQSEASTSTPVFCAASSVLPEASVVNASFRRPAHAFYHAMRVHDLVLAPHQAMPARCRFPAPGAV